MTDARVDIKGRDDTGRAFSSVNRRLGLTAENARVLSTTLVAASAAVAALTARGVRNADAIAKQAAVVDLAASRYQGLVFQASQLGVQQQLLDASLVRFTKRLGLADQGLGAAAGAYERYGIATRDAFGQLRDTDEVLLQVTDTIAGLSTAQERVAATTQFFGDDAARLRPLLEGGSDAMDRQREAARSLGLVLEDDILTNAEAASDQLDIMARVMEANLTRATANLFPVIVSTGNAFVELTNKAADFLKLADDQGVERLNGRLGVVREQLREMRKQAAGTRTFSVLGFDLFEAAANPVTQQAAQRQVEALEVVEAELVERLREAKERIRAERIDPADLLVSGPPGSSAGGSIGSAIGLAFGNAANAANDATAAWGERAVQAREALERELALVEQASMTRLEIEAASFDRRVDILQRAHAKGLVAEERYQEILQGLAERHGEAMTELYEQGLESSTDATTRAATRINGVLGETFSGFQDGVDGMVNAFQRGLDRMVADLVSSGLSEAFGGSGGGGGFLATAASSIFGALFGGPTDLTGAAGGAAQGPPPPPGFQTGGSFVVPGSSGTDSVVPLMRVSPGELVEITPKRERSNGETIIVQPRVEAPAAGPMTHIEIIDNRGAGAPPVEVQRSTFQDRQRIRLLIEPEVLDIMGSSRGRAITRSGRGGGAR